MHHETGLLMTIAAAFVLAFAFGFGAARLRLPPLVGYLMAGIAVGPFTPGIVADSGLASQLAEVGVILLMFGVGLHFSIDDLKAVRRVAVPGAIGQIAVATAIGIGFAALWGWSLGAGLVYGLCVSVASTVVLLKALEERNLLGSPDGRVAVGWLVVEDIVMVFALVLLPALSGALGGTVPAGQDPAGGASALALAALVTLVKVAAFVAVTLGLGPRLLPPLLRHVARLGSREVFTLAVLASAMGIAVMASGLFGVSFALGAFCAGMVLAKSEYSHRAASESVPLQDAFAVLFFVSVGMLFDPSVLIREPVAVALTVLLIVVGKGLIAAVIVLALGLPASTAVLVGAGLAQIGEFSFILAGLGVALALLPGEGRDLVLAGAILSMMLNPLALAAARPVADWLAGSRALAAGRMAREERFARLAATLSREEAEAEAEAPPRATLGSDETMDRFAVFGSLPPAARIELAALFTPRLAQPGERVIRRGDEADEIFFVSSGSVEVDLTVGAVTLGPGEFFGEMAVLTGQPRSANVTAIDYTELLVLSRSNLALFEARHPELSAELGGVAAQRNAMNRGRVPEAPMPT